MRQKLHIPTKESLPFPFSQQWEAVQQTLGGEDGQDGWHRVALLDFSSLGIRGCGHSTFPGGG